jgi:acyl dehydratase
VAIPPTAVGTTLPPLTVTVERGRLQLFAKATGQTDPLYVDPGAARAQGHRDLPVPPTYLFGLELEQPDPFGWMTSLGVDLNAVLHGSQSFRYDQLAYAGDTLTFSSTITDTYSKKGGALDFIDRRVEVTRDGRPIATLLQTTVIKNTVKSSTGSTA